MIDQRHHHERAHPQLAREPIEWPIGADGNPAAPDTAGFGVLYSFALPPSAWWDEYYTPLSRNIERLRPTADGALRAVIEETEREIEMYRRFGSSYGYVFYLMRRTD